MKNRFTKIISTLAAAVLLTTSALADTYYRKDAISVNSTHIQALSLNLRKGADKLYSTIDSELIELRCDISCDDDGYTYVDFIADEPISTEDIEIPVSFFDSIANATSSPCEIEMPEGYQIQDGYASGEILDEDGYCVSGFQFIRPDNEKRTMQGKIITLKFSYAPMEVWNDRHQIPVMRYFNLKQHGPEGERGEYFEILDEYEMYADMPEINISYLKEQEKQINELNAKIDMLQARVEYLEANPNYDFNNDGKVSISDVVLLMRYVNES